MKKRVFAIAFTDSVHNLVHQEAPKSVIEFYKKVTLHWTQMADGILKFMIGHLGLGSNVQLSLVDFKVL